MQAHRDIDETFMFFKRRCKVITSKQSMILLTITVAFPYKYCHIKDRGEQADGNQV